MLLGKGAMTHIELYNVVVGFSLKSELAVYCQGNVRPVFSDSNMKNFAGQKRL